MDDLNKTSMSGKGMLYPVSQLCSAKVDLSFYLFFILYKHVSKSNAGNTWCGTLTTQSPPVEWLCIFQLCLFATLHFLVFNCKSLSLLCIVQHPRVVGGKLSSPFMRTSKFRKFPILLQPPNFTIAVECFL